MKLQCTHTDTEQNWLDGTTTYWFVIDGKDDNIERQFYNETFGIVDDCGQLSVVYSDNIPVTNQAVVETVKRFCELPI